MRNLEPSMQVQGSSLYFQHPCKMIGAVACAYNFRARDRSGGGNGIIWELRGILDSQLRQTDECQALYERLFQNMDEN